MEKLKSFKGDKTWQELLLDYALYIILVIMIIGVIVADPTFLSINNFWKILAQASTRGILALGVAGMIVLAGTDLSAGRILGCGAAISCIPIAECYIRIPYVSSDHRTTATDPAFAVVHRGLCGFLSAERFWCSKTAHACIYYFPGYTAHCLWCSVSVHR